MNRGVFQDGVYPTAFGSEKMYGIQIGGKPLPMRFTTLAEAEQHYRDLLVYLKSGKTPPRPTHPTPIEAMFNETAALMADPNDPRERR